MCVCVYVCVYIYTTSGVWSGLWGIWGQLRTIDLKCCRLQHRMTLYKRTVGHRGIGELLKKINFIFLIST